MKIFGLEHTGQLGDALLSTYYQEKEENFSVPKFGERGIQIILSVSLMSQY